ncbi:MAG: hypothetical protein WBL86_02120, partial [Pseudolabrys sp.]
MREVQQPLAPSMDTERGGAKLIDWLDELTMIRAVRSVRNCRRCCRVRPLRLVLLTRLSIADSVEDKQTDR